MSAEKLLKKMSMKTLLDASPANTIKQKLANREIKFNDILVRIVGMVDGKKIGNTTYGEYTAFLGNFIANVVATGDVYESGVLFLDKSTTEAVAQRLDASPDGVEIAVEVAIVFDPSPDSKGYMYVTRPLQSAEMASRRQQLLAKLRQAALPAPTPAEDTPAPAEAVPVPDDAPKGGKGK